MLRAVSLSNETPFFPISFNQRAFEQLVVCHCAIRTCAVKRDPRFVWYPVGFFDFVEHARKTSNALSTRLPPIAARGQRETSHRELTRIIKKSPKTRVETVSLVEIGRTRVQSPAPRAQNRRGCGGAWRLDISDLVIGFLHCDRVAESISID